MPSMIDGIGTVTAIKKNNIQPATTGLGTMVPTTGTYLGQIDSGIATAKATTFQQPKLTAPPAPVTQPSTSTGGVSKPATTTGASTTTTTTSQPPAAPAATGTDTYADSQLAQFTEQDIAAALAAIEAEFGLTREQLLADQTMIGAQYRLLTAQMARAQARALESAESGALQRGLFRSGIFAAETGDIAQSFGEQQSQLAQQTAEQTSGLQAQIDALEAQKAAAKAAEETAIRRGEMTARLQAAGLG